ncbi:MAG: Spy/CpxP family protein refolding chaperone [Rhodospirillaceae bacterium]|nr:Spy/CpxP family protein refolding chaperone [Rhodospirillaceae bacterium]
MLSPRHRILAGALAIGLLGAAAPAVFAQPANPAAPTRSFNRHMDGRIAFLKAELKITPAQQAAFDNYVRVMRQNADEMGTAMQKRRDHRASGDQRPKPRTAIEQMERRAEASKLAAAQSQRSLEAFKPLYALLSDEQKQVADELIARGGRGGPGHRRT